MWVLLILDTESGHVVCDPMLGFVGWIPTDLHSYPDKK